MIRYAIEAQKMDEIMSRLHRLFDIRITFFDMQEHELEDFHIKPMTKFCRQMRRNADFDLKCKTSDQCHLKKAKQLRDVHIYQCHSGLIEGMVPLYDRRNIYLGAIVFGQLRDDRTPPNPAWNKTQKDLYLSLPACTLERAEDIGYLLKCVSESIINHELIRYQNKPWAKNVENYIEQHLHEKITTKQLAKTVNKSVSFIAHHFSLEFGQTPRQYILKRKMEEAKIMLQNESNVQETAEKLGFYDAFHFSKTFKNFWGISPSKFIKS